MTGADLSTQFEKISDKAKTANDKIKAANQRTRDQLEADVASARDKASAAAEHFPQDADAAHKKESSHRREIRGAWQAHVANVRANVKTQKAELDANEAARDANEAEAYALEAIDLAQDAIDEAEHATLDAIHARAKAESLIS